MNVLWKVTFVFSRLHDVASCMLDVEIDILIFWKLLISLIIYIGSFKMLREMSGISAVFFV